VIIGRLVSLLGQRLAATVVALWVILIAALGVLAGAPPDSTWSQLKSLPHQGNTAVFAIAVDPSNNQVLVAGTSDGSLLRSTNGGTTWTQVHAGKSNVTTINFSPFTSGLVLAGTRGGGALASRDGGVTWSVTSGLEGRNVRAFAFALTLVAAGTDHGVYTSADGLNWTQSGLSDRSVNALAVEAIHAPVRLVAGGDLQGTGGALPLYQSLDAGVTWTQLNPAISGTIVVKVVAGPLPPTGNVRPLIVGTNTGLFGSNDNGASFAPLSGGGLLPTTDYTQVIFITDHHDRFYAASDGGGSGSGGLWRTNDGGQTFTSLQSPEPAVTAIAVSNDEQPTLYVATFHPSTHTPSLWIYHDTGGTPQGPPVPQSTAASGTRAGRTSDTSVLSAILALPELPYVGLGIGALAVILTAVVAHLRARPR
jgi:photosystem II stability/assembly factor-like uncharacterized protein